MVREAELILMAVPALWQVNPRSDGVGRSAPAAQNLGVGLLVTALAQLSSHLHVRNIARRFDWTSDWIRFAVSYFFRVSRYCTKIRSGPVVVLDWLNFSKGGGLAVTAHRAPDPRNFVLGSSDVC